VGVAEPVLQPPGDRDDGEDAEVLAESLLDARPAEQVLVVRPPAMNLVIRHV
jgi:hypothetical protein